MNINALRNMLFFLSLFAAAPAAAQTDRELEAGVKAEQAKDYAEALSNYSVSCVLSSNPYGCINVARLHDLGRGTPKNYASART